MKIIHNVGNVGVLIIAGVLTCMATGYVFANSYEVITQEDLPSIPSISKFEVKEVEKLFAEKLSIDNYRWNSIQISSVGNKLQLTKAWTNNEGILLQQASKGQYFFLNPDPVHVAGDSVIYLSKNWRTIYNPQNIQNGDLVRIENDKSVYTYKIIDLSLRSVDEPYIRSADPRINLLLIIWNSESGSVFYINAIQISDEEKI